MAARSDEDGEINRACCLEAAKGALIAIVKSVDSIGKLSHLIASSVSSALTA
jgi:hypothetical protein